jgi:hypothetical protein
VAEGTSPQTRAAGSWALPIALPYGTVSCGRRAGPGSGAQVAPHKTSKVE